MGALKSLVIAVTGTFDHEHGQLKKWIEANSGRYSPSVRKGITHLIAGKDAWKSASDAVRAAVDIGAFVVTYDWLEDSLHKGRRLAEKKYTWEYKWKERRAIKEMERDGMLADTKKFNDGCEEAKKATGTGTSKSRPRVIVRKPKQSKSFFFSDVINVPFMSAADDLKRKREERETTKARKAGEQSSKKAEQVKIDHGPSSALSATKSFTSNAEAASPSASATSHALGLTPYQPASLLPGAPAKKPSLKDLYHYYLDTTGFEYKIVLTRCNLRANEITRYRLSILESHTKPNVYCTFVEYFPPGSAGTTSNSGEACIQALFDFDATFHGTNNADDVRSTLTDGDATPSHPEAARLLSILTPSSPSASQPYKSLLAPMNSPFATAWRVFRHAFRDLTLLAWEERFDISKTLYKARAHALSIEPFVYVRPKQGMPLGLRVQQVGLFQNPVLPVRDTTGGIVTAPPSAAGSSSGVASTGSAPRGGGEEGYTYNAFALPSLAHPLGDGIIGHALLKDTAAAEKLAEKARRRAEEAEEEQMRVLGLACRKEKENQTKPNFSRPLFNGVTGRPMVDAWGRRKAGPARGRDGGSMGGCGSAVKGRGVVKHEYRRPFPSERKGL